MSRYWGRVKDTSSSSGTGNLTLSNTAPAGGFHTFASRYAIGERFKATIQSNASDESETGTCYLSAATTLVREKVEESTNGDALVNFTAGGLTVFGDFTGEDATAVMSSSFLLLSRGNFLQ